MTFRNRALLDLAHEAPCLLLPGQHECLSAPSEPCHSDMIRHGRGEHHKSHDCFAVPGCHNAHLSFTRANLGKEGYHAAWIEAMERWILYLWISEKIRLTDINQRPKELSMEAPMCKICEHRHYVRDPHQFAPDTSRQGRRVLKVEGVSSDATRTASTEKPDPPPATSGKPAGKKGQRRAAKPSPGKRKPRTKIIATYTPPNGKKRVKK